MEVARITELEDFRGLLYEIRDLAIGGAMYASYISEDKIDAPFNLAMYNVISRNASAILRLFDIIEFMPEVGQRVELKCKAVEA
jgi:hypothetical protein